jgi:putative ABC transport system permease protein
VANITALPLEVGPDISFEIVGQAASAGSAPEEQVRAVSPHYFAVMRIPIVAGRAFTERDTEGASAVVIINQALARKYFRKLSPLGERLLLGRALGPRFADVPRNYRRSGGHA